MKQFKTLAFVAVLALPASNVHAGPLGGGQAIPRLLTTVSGVVTPLGNVLNPLLNPLAGLTGPLVGNLVRNTTPQVVHLLNVVLTRPAAKGTSVSAPMSATPGLPPLAGLE